MAVTETIDTKEFLILTVRLKSAGGLRRWLAGRLIVLAGWVLRCRETRVEFEDDR